MKTFASFLAAASMAATPLPAIAQPTADATQQDLRCAAWAAMISGDMGEDDDSWGAFAMMMTYFIGRYEGATGEDIGDAMTTDIVLSVAENLEAETEICAGLMEDLGNRMEGLGAALSEASEA